MDKDDEGPSQGATAKSKSNNKKSQEALQRESTNHNLSLASNVIFVIATAIYVAMEVTMLPYYRFYRDVPYDIRESDNEDVWWQYYNETDAFPDYLYNTTDDSVWGEWFNNSFLDEDAVLNEFVFQVPNADKKYADPEESYEAWVSQYMILYFCAAFGFLVTGILQYTIATRNDHFWERILYYVMIVAALFGLCSAMIVNKDPRGSTILNSVSVHLFAVEAIAIIIARWRQTNRIKAGNEHGDSIHSKSSNVMSSLHGGILAESSSAWKTGLLFFGDISFFIGTSGDVVLSYFYIFEQDYFEQAVAAITTSGFWLLSALIYLSGSCMGYHEFRRDAQEKK